MFMDANWTVSAPWNPSDQGKAFGYNDHINPQQAADWLYSPERKAPAETSRAVPVQRTVYAAEDTEPQPAATVPSGASGIIGIVTRTISEIFRSFVRGLDFIASGTIDLFAAIRNMILPKKETDVAVAEAPVEDNGTSDETRINTPSADTAEEQAMLAPYSTYSDAKKSHWMGLVGYHNMYGRATL